MAGALCGTGPALILVVACSVSAVFLTHTVTQVWLLSKLQKEPDVNPFFLEDLQTDVISLPDSFALRGSGKIWCVGVFPWILLCLLRNQD